MKKFNELLMKDWHDALLYDKALDGFSQMHFESMPPPGLLQLGYESWLGYLCRTEVPENYQGRALEEFLAQGKHLRPYQGPHPLLCGYNLTDLRLYAQYQALPVKNESASRLMNHWSMSPKKMGKRFCILSLPFICTPPVLLMRIWYWGFPIGARIR